MGEPAAPAPLARASVLGETLRVTEIFYSLQGETSRAGLPTVFVRLTGCPLRCGYCDTTYAFHGGESWALGDIVAEVGRHGARYVTVTGGEPLAQKNACRSSRCCATRGTRYRWRRAGRSTCPCVDPRVSKILDIKTPGSGEVEKNRWENLAHLHPTDEIKFVICDRRDYEWAVQQLADRALDRLCPVLFSPAYGELPAAQLATWILRDRLPVRFQIQLHKILWGEARGR